MKRVVYVKNALGTDKYVLQCEYNGFGLYQEKTPNGYLVHQSWLLTSENVAIICESYNNKCEEEMLDVIDDYKERKRFGLKVFHRSGLYIVHPNGNEII